MPSILSLVALPALALSTWATAAPAAFQTRADCSAKAPLFLLAGDSTTAIQSAGGGGWGNGFLSVLQNGATGTNYGHNGATTVSFVENGDWAENIVSNVEANAAEYDVYVTIQFGHNDQKAAANISLEQYQANLQTMATQVKTLGGTPILVTPLSRREFSTTTGLVTNRLANQTRATIAAAAATGSQYIDLNQASFAYVNDIGMNASYAYNLVASDRTHLNAHGSVVFGRMVADLMLGHVPTISAGSGADWTPAGCFTSYFGSNQTLSDLIWTGVAA